MLGMMNIHENLLEALLELQAYADVQAVLAKYDGTVTAQHSSVQSDMYGVRSHDSSLRFYCRHQLAKISHNMLHIRPVESAGYIR